MSDLVHIDALRHKIDNTQHVRWFEVFHRRGKTDQFLDELRTVLTRRRLTDVVCGVRLERRAQSEFYFALTYETEAPGVLPDEVRNALAEVPLFSNRIGAELELSALARFFSSEVKVTALGHSLSYRQLKLDTAEDPFRATDSPVAGSADDDRVDKLLWYLSAVGHGRWATFRSSCAVLGHDAPGAAARVSRNLRLLGHLEVTRDGESWGVTRPAIVVVPTPDGDVLRFATGARHIQDGGTRDMQRHAPARVTPVSCTPEDRVLEDPASTLAANLPDIDAFIASLEAVGGVSPTAQRLSRHDGLVFRPCAFNGQPGLFEVTSRDDRTITLFFDGQSWRRGDWYGLRFLALRAEHALMPTRYDSTSWRLAVPADQRPPEAYERPLVLSSGLVPRRDDQWWIYENVAPTVAARWAERLEAPLTEERT